MIGLNKIGLNQVQLNQLYLNTLCACQKSSGGDGFPRLPGDVTRWSFKGLTNEQMSKNPRLEDADHKGRFLTFKNFAWGEMSGVGGYTQNYNNSAWRLALDRAETTKTEHSFNVTSVTSTVAAFYYQSGSGQEPFTVKSQIVRVSGLTDGQSIKYGTGKKSVLVIESDGIYTLPPFDFAAKGIWYGFSFGKIQESCNITLEQLPYYPGFIIGDGVDDYAVTEKNLDFEDTYTVYTAFIPFQEDPARDMLLCGKAYTKDFYVQYEDLKKLMYYSARTRAIVKFSNGFNLIACKRTPTQMVAKNLLTGETIVVDANSLVENPGLYYLWTTSSKMEYAKAAIAGQVICNGHFTTDEEDTKVLNWYKKEYPWLFFDQAWTVTGKTNEDTDRATIANITGNGNNLVLSNFGFAGNSGYGEYPTTKSKYEFQYETIALRFTPTDNIKNIRIKFVLTGLSEANGEQFAMTIRNSQDKQIDKEIYTKDGTYVFTYEYTGEDQISVWGYSWVKNSETNYTVDIVPDHEGYLVTDGVDDKVYSSAFTLGKKFTVVGEWIFIKAEQLYNLAGIVKDPSFFLYNYRAGTNVYILSPSGALIRGEYAIKAIRSSNIVYLNNWDERKLNTEQNLVDKGRPFYIGWNGTSFTRLAFKNIAIYGKELSKEDTIKAYIYLQTLKAK